MNMEMLLFGLVVLLVGVGINTIFWYIVSALKRRRYKKTAEYLVERDDKEFLEMKKDSPELKYMDFSAMCNYLNGDISKEQAEADTRRRGFWEQIK